MGFASAVTGPAARNGPCLPGPVTRRDGNELIILELHSAASAVAAFVSGPDLGHTEH